MPQCDIRATGVTNTTGTKIRFLPDGEIFPKIDFDYDILEKRLREERLRKRGAEAKRAKTERSKV